jgi:hypothetical protein
VDSSTQFRLTATFFTAKVYAQREHTVKTNIEFDRLMLKSICALTEAAESALGTDEYETRVTELVLQTAILAGHCNDLLTVRTEQPQRSQSHLTVVK